MKKSGRIPVLALVLLLSSGGAAQAQCENPLSAVPALVQWISTADDIVSRWTTNGNNFVTEMLSNTATYEVESRLHEFDDNYSNSLANFGSNRFVPALRESTKQLAIAQIQQTMKEGIMIDAQGVNEKQLEKEVLEAEAHRRYIPSELACQLDTAGPAQTKAYEMSRALSRGLAKDNAGRSSNAVGSVSATGRAAEMKAFFQEYVENFCDNTKGDQGCTTPGTYPGKHKDIPALLWGNKQTIDMDAPGSKLIVEASLRYLAFPASPDVLFPTALDSALGHEALLTRRANQARINTIYHAVGHMLAERAAGSGLNTQGMRTKAGMTAPESSTNASYSEIQEVMNRERFYDPDYIVRMAGSPTQVVREQGAINAIRLQTMNDMYRRMEEMLFVEAAAYAHALDKQRPSSAMQATPLQ